MPRLSDRATCCIRSSMIKDEERRQTTLKPHYVSSSSQDSSAIFSLHVLAKARGLESSVSAAKKEQQMSASQWVLNKALSSRKALVGECSRCPVEPLALLCE